MGQFIGRNFIVFFYTIASIMFFCGELFAQANYEMRVANGVKVNSNLIEFDVFIKSTGPNFKLTSYQCTFSFTQSIVNNGSVNFSYVPGTSQFLNLPPQVSIEIQNINGVYILTFASMPDQAVDEETISATERKVGRFRLSNNISYTGEEFNFLWCFSGNVPTILTGSGFENITNKLSHSNLSGAATFPLTVSVENDWNLISIPGAHPVDQNINTWWINRDPAANVFSGSYQFVTELETGKGYWMKHIGNKVYNTGDEWPAEGILFSPNFPIIGRAGWNFIGVYNFNMSVAGITTTPGGLQNGFVYGFSPVTGYTPKNILVPGNGYLIYLTGAGLINLPDSGFSGLSKAPEYSEEGWGRITFTDNTGKICTLFSVKGDADKDDYILPPAPPSGVFDIRFSSGKFADDLSKGIHSIEMSGIEYPVKIKVENMSLRIQYGGVNEKLDPGEELTLNSSLNNKLLVSENFIPVEYILEQNYPNPFNPGTIISFAIPEDVNVVKLTIYDALGQKITELVNSGLNAGKYNYYWDAGNNASGIYIYELRTEKFVSTRKMMLLK